MKTFLNELIALRKRQSFKKTPVIYAPTPSM